MFAWPSNVGAYVEIPRAGAAALDDGGVARVLNDETLARDGEHSRYIGATAPILRRTGPDAQSVAGFAGVVVLPTGLRLWRQDPANGQIEMSGRIVCTEDEAFQLIGITGATTP
jgi:hypothetical protein